MDLTNLRDNVDPKGPINNKQALVQIMWQTGDNLLSDPNGNTYGGIV